MTPNIRKVFLVFLILGCCLVSYFLFLSPEGVPEPVEEVAKGGSPEKVRCYRSRGLEVLPSLKTALPPKDKSIFFLETSCYSQLNGKSTINSRQACAVESAARANPNFAVYLLYVSPGVIKMDGSESDHFLRVLQAYDNIKILHIDLNEYFKGTPVQNIWDNGKVENSNYVFSHTSDVLSMLQVGQEVVGIMTSLPPPPFLLESTKYTETKYLLSSPLLHRFLTLWKFGGIYLDLDVVVLKSLEDLPLNFISIESKQLVGSTVMSFSAEGEGHTLAEECLDDLKEKFNGQIWTNNGPGVATRLGKRICNVKDVPDLFGKVCRNFTFYEPSVFLPVPWNKWQMYFQTKSIEEVEKMSNESYTLHVWNNLNPNEKTKVTDNVPYTVFAKKYCPNVFKQCKEFF